MINRTLVTLAWCLPYFISGFSAPFIFRHARTLQEGGHYAGALFIFAGIWSLYLAFHHNFPGGVKGIFIAVLGLQLIFWSWRFFNDTPLNASSLLGINGSAWHGILTCFYLAVGLCLLTCEFRARRSSV